MASWTRRLLEETDSDASKADLSASCGRSERMYRYVLPTLARPSRGLRSDIASYRFSRSPKFSCVIASLSLHIIALGVVLSKDCGAAMPCKTATRRHSRLAQERHQIPAPIDHGAKGEREHDLSCTDERRTAVAELAFQCSDSADTGDVEHDDQSEDVHLLRCHACPKLGCMHQRGQHDERKLLAQDAKDEDDQRHRREPQDTLSEGRRPCRERNQPPQFVDNIEDDGAGRNDGERKDHEILEPEPGLLERDAQGRPLQLRHLHDESWIGPRDETVQHASDDEDDDEADDVQRQRGPETHEGAHKSQDDDRARRARDERRKYTGDEAVPVAFHDPCPQDCGYVAPKPEDD